MTMPPQFPYAVLDGAFGDNAIGSYSPARAEVSNGFVTLSVATPTGWVQYFSVPAAEVTVKSAAQRITLVVRGQNYPVLADPTVVNRVIRYGVLGTAANVLDKPAFGAGVDLGRGLTQISAANSWSTCGGPGFIEAARASGANVSRLGYGAIAAIGCVGGLVVVVLVVGLTLAALAL